MYIDGEQGFCDIIRFRSLFREIERETICTRVLSQTLFFKAETGKALTIVLAGLALTSHILPKISFLQAFVAGLTRVLTMTRPGKVNLPVVVTSLVPISARLLMILAATPCLISCSSAIAFAIALFPC